MATTKQKINKLIWIDMTSPTRDEVKALMENYKIDEMLADELLVPTMRDRIDVYKNYIFLVLHFPKSQSFPGESREHEIDFILGKNFLITVHYGPITPLYEFSKLVESNSVFKNNEGKHAGFIFFYLIREFYRMSADKLFDIGNELRIVEKNIFAGREGEMVEVLSHTNRKLIDFRQATHAQTDILQTLELIGVDFYGKEFHHYLRSITSEFNKTQNILENQKSILNDLRETNDSLLSNKTNKVVQILTIFTVIALPLGIIPQIFGMNIESMPIAGSTGGFWKVILLMIGFAGIILIYFKRRRWL